MLFRENTIPVANPSFSKENDDVAESMTSLEATKQPKLPLILSIILKSLNCGRFNLPVVIL